MRRYVLRLFSTEECNGRFVRWSDVGGGLRWIGICRGEARNALSVDLVGELETVVERCDEEGCRAVMIGSDVDGVFCAGADLKERMTMGVEETRRFVGRLRRLMTRIAEIPVPTVACIDGHALGGGAELALACDFRFLSSSAEMGFPETKVGIIPGAGGTQRLPRLIGEARAKELIFSGERVTADRALAIGLADRVVSCPRQEATMYLRRLVETTAPVAVMTAKQAIRWGLQSPSAEDGLKVEEQMYERVLATCDREEGLLAFKEKRKPVFQGK